MWLKSKCSRKRVKFFPETKVLRVLNAYKGP